jgi:hypothetical protein
MRSRSKTARLAACFAGLLAFCLPGAARAVELHLADDSLFDPATSPPPRGNLPVLFVHGHNTASGNDADFNYRKNWRQSLNGLPSFQQTIDLTENSGLGIEPYYIRFVDQNRSIVEDAREIGEAVDLILRRHDPGFDPTDSNSTTSVQVAIIAYSKGTISTRLYLKSLQGLVPEIPAPPQTDAHRVSEFVAISPPNHGMNVVALGALTSLAVQQLLNGHGATTCLPLPAAAAHDFIERLNDHPIADTATLDAGDVYPSEAPGSRPDDQPPTAGILYVTLFADGNRDLVGGDSVPNNNDCEGRKLALNLAPDAINIPLGSIAGGNDGVNVHQNTVHTAEVMCLALYAALHHRSPQGQTCQLVNDMPVIPPPARAAAMLTLDFSGSMAAPACPGCVTRAAVLKDAVELFVQLWSAVGGPADRLGVTYFRTNVDRYAFGTETLPLLRDAAGDIITNVNGQAPGNATAMGGGLQRSIESLRDLAADAASRRVILFTDGMQNVNPMVLAVAGHHEIADEPGRPGSNVTPTNIRLDQLGGIAVDTIGVGAGQAFVGLLQDIADETGGHAQTTQAPDQQLRRFFVETLINALRGFSPQLIAYRRGTIAADGGRETFAVEEGGRKLVLKLSWKRGSTIDFSVAKDGVDVTAAGHFIPGDFYRIFVIDLPAKGPNGPIGARGDWQLRIAGKAGTPYEAAAIVDTERTSYDGAFEGRRPRVGDLVALTVRIAADKRPIKGPVKVTATLLAPGVAVGNVIAGRPAVVPDKLRGAEPGATAAERALLAVAQSPRQWAALKTASDRLEFAPDGKGSFRAAFRPHRPGVYLAVVEIAGSDSEIGSFTRTLTATTVVGFGKASTKASTLSLSETGVAGGQRYVTMIATPRDARANNLGPGLSSSVGLKLSAGRAIGGAHDLGDGRYLFLIALAARDDPAITLSVADSTLFTGKLSALARRAHR